MIEISGLPAIESHDYWLKLFIDWLPPPLVYLSLMYMLSLARIITSGFAPVGMLRVCFYILSLGLFCEFSKAEREAT